MFLTSTKLRNFVTFYKFLIHVGVHHTLSGNNRVSSFYWTRGSKQCFLTCFSYFSCYFCILVFSQNRYLLISSRLSRLHGNPISRPVSRTIGTPSQYVAHAPQCFWHRTRGFLKASCSWESSSSLTTGEFSLFRLLPKVSAANVHWTEHESYLSSSTFLRDLGLAQLCSTARVWNPQGTSKLMNRLIVACLMTASSRFAQGDSAGFPCYEIFCSGIFNVPLPYGMRLKVIPKGCHIFERLCPQQHRSAVDVMRDSRG